MANKRLRNSSGTRRYLAGEAISDGDLVMLDSAGELFQAAASASNQGCVGIAVGDCADAAYCIVESGEVLLVGTSIAQTSVGLKVYASDVDTIDETQGVNEPVAGILMEVVSATSGWVLVDPGVNAATV